MADCAPGIHVPVLAALPHAFSANELKTRTFEGSCCAGADPGLAGRGRSPRAPHMAEPLLDAWLPAAGGGGEEEMDGGGAGVRAGAPRQTWTQEPLINHVGET